MNGQKIRGKKNKKRNLIFLPLIFVSLGKFSRSEEKIADCELRRCAGLPKAGGFGENAMVSKEQCMDLIVSNVPEFSHTWKEYRDYWEGEEAGLCNDISAFSDYVADQINQMERDKLKRIFDLIEGLLTDGDQDVQDAVATCFLENLLNLVSANKLSSPDFVPFLGPNSRAYCRAWDNFTGVATEGL